MPKFNLNDAVELVLSGECGVIQARTEYVDSTPHYYIHYKAADGCATTGWFCEEDIQLATK